MRVPATLKGFFVGTMIATDHNGYKGEELSDPNNVATACSEFNMLTPGNAMKMGTIHPRHNENGRPQQVDYDFALADTFAGLAAACGQRLVGTPLVWHDQLPDWLVNPDHWTPPCDPEPCRSDPWAMRFSVPQLKDILRRHIKTVVKHFAGRVAVWDVVNEPIEVDGPGGYRDSVWKHRLGEGYIDLAFQWAHEADPLAKLFLNDYGADTINAKSDKLYEVAQGLVNRGVPINGVGFQYHMTLGDAPTYRDPVVENLTRFADLGLETRISEADVGLIPPATMATIGDQAGRYYAVAAACFTPGTGCHMFTVWGTIDKYWGAGAALCCGVLFGPDPDHPNKQYMRKLAYFAVRKAIDDF